MHDANLLVPGDDDPAAMTTNERTAWAYLVTVIVTSGVYLALMVTRMAAGPVATIVWVGPMLWTIGSSVVGTIAGTIAGTITATIAATPAVVSEPTAASPMRCQSGADASDRPDQVSSVTTGSTSASTSTRLQ